MFGSAGNIFGLVVVKSYRRHDFNHAERRIAHDGTGQLLAGNILFDDEALAIGPVLARELLRRMGMILAHDEDPDARAFRDRLDDVGRRQHVGFGHLEPRCHSPSGTGTSAARNRSLATSFCMASADAITPEWLYGIARISSTPCSVPSSPGRPCSMLRATSGLTVVSTAAMSRPTSMRVTRWPRRASASAQALPERNDISRSADQPPIRTATCLLILRPTCDAD